MTKAEKAEMVKKFQQEREQSQVVTSTVQPATEPVKTFEVDGEQIPYTPEKPKTQDRSISNAWKEIARNRD